MRRDDHLPDASGDHLGIDRSTVGLRRGQCGHDVGARVARVGEPVGHQGAAVVIEALTLRFGGLTILGDLCRLEPLAVLSQRVPFGARDTQQGQERQGGQGGGERPDHVRSAMVEHRVEQIVHDGPHLAVEGANPPLGEGRVERLAVHGVFGRVVVQGRAPPRDGVLRDHHTLRAGERVRVDAGGQHIVEAGERPEAVPAPTVCHRAFGSQVRVGGMWIGDETLGHRVEVAALRHRASTRA